MSITQVRKLLGIGKGATRGHHLIPLERLIEAFGLRLQLTDTATDKEVGRSRDAMSLDELALHAGVRITIRKIRRS